MTELQTVDETLSWLEDSLCYAHARGQTGLEELLEAVRDEVEFEASYPGLSQFARRLLPEQAINDSRYYFVGQIAGGNLGRSDGSLARESRDDE